MGEKGVWYGICAKYLAFGTYPTSNVGALRGENLGCVCFGWKWFQEIIFTLFHVFGCNGKYNFLEIAFLLTVIYPFDPEMNLRFHFPFNSFPDHISTHSNTERREKRNRKQTHTQQHRVDPRTATHRSR